MIDTRLVCGFLDAGKTSYIQDCIRNDYFYKYGTTLILCFEQGGAQYDETLLYEKKTFTAFYDDRLDVTQFCRENIERYHPDRVYVEMNIMIQGLREKLPDFLDVTFSITLIDWPTLDLYFTNFKQLMGQMVKDSAQVVFRGCPSKELLAPYSQSFQLMNNKASYLRQDPMGYHERAFDLFVPYSLDGKKIVITKENFLIFWLDAGEHPEHYDGKIVAFSDPLELRHVLSDTIWSVGRVVMTCCMADLQFMAFELKPDQKTEKTGLNGGWITFEALAESTADEFGRKKLKLIVQQSADVQPPVQPILMPA